MPCNDLEGARQYVAREQPSVAEVAEAAAPVAEDVGANVLEGVRNWIRSGRRTKGVSLAHPPVLGQPRCVLEAAPWSRPVEHVRGVQSAATGVLRYVEQQDLVGACYNVEAEPTLRRRVALEQNPVAIIQELAGRLTDQQSAVRRDLLRACDILCGIVAEHESGWARQERRFRIVWVLRFVEHPLPGRRWLTIKAGELAKKVGPLGYERVVFDSRPLPCCASELHPGLTAARPAVSVSNLLGVGIPRRRNLVDQNAASRRPVGDAP